MTREGRGLLIAAVRLLLVVGVLAVFGLWWSRQKAPDFRVDLRVALQPDGEALRAPQLRLGGETRDALRIPVGSTLLCSFTVPGDDAVLRFHDGHLQGMPELAVSLLRAGGAREELDAHATTEQGWTMRRVELPVSAGENVALELAARAGRGRAGLGEVYVADVVLESEGRGVDETEIPIVTRAIATDLLARFGDGRQPAPAMELGADVGLDGPPCIPLGRDEPFYVTADAVPADARLDVVLHVGRPFPEGPALSGRVVVLAGGEPLAVLPVSPPAEGRLAAEFVAQIDLAAWAGKSLDLGLQREGAANLFVGVRELSLSTPVTVPRTPYVKRRTRNVLLIVVDALRPDRLGCYGHASAATPAIDAIAALGGRWERVIAPSSWTLPDVASLLTGVSPLTHGLGLAPGNVLSARLATLAQSASWSGVTTGLLSSNALVGRRTGLDQGYETVVEGNVPAPVLAERALDWLEQSQQFRWFLTLMIADPHHPYEPDLQDVARLKGLPAPAFVESLRRLDSRPGAAERLAMELGTFYDGEVAGVDRAIDTLLRWLAERDLLRDTLVAVVGAEGEEFYEHNGRLHGQTLFDEVVSVPLVMAGPGLYGADGGAFVESEPIDLVDVTQLLAAFGGLSTQTALQGRLPPPFSPRLPDNVSHSVIVPMPPAATADLRASRSRRYLRLLDVERGTESLYDLEADPGATRNLLLAPVDKALRLQAEALERSLLDWQRACLATSAAQAAPLEAEAP